MTGGRWQDGRTIDKHREVGGKKFRGGREALGPMCWPW